MAERIKEFSRPRNATRKYPWDLWCDGSVWRIAKGEDFSSKISGITNCLYVHARRNGMKVRVSVTGEDTVEFQFTKN